MKGSEFAKDIATLQGSEREAAVLHAFAQGSIPPWIASGVWQPVDVEADIKGATYHLRYFATPDYFSIGDDNYDFLRMPARPPTYQTIASALMAILPSRRMVNAIWGSAGSAGNARLEPHPLPGAADTRSSAPFIQINDIINDQLEKIGKWPTTSLIAGQKKDVVIGPGLDGTKVAIYGWHQKNGKPIQPYPGPHDVEHVDYSHGGRLVSRAAFLNGEAIDLAQLFVDKDFSVLVSDQGPFNPIFPNALTSPSGAKSALEKALAISRKPRGEPIKVEPIKSGWGTLEWLTAVGASLGIAAFAIDRIIKPKHVLVPHTHASPKPEPGQ